MFSSNWDVDCGGPNHTSLVNCQFANDFTAMVTLIKTLGATPAGPKIYVAIPPPLMGMEPAWMKWPQFMPTIDTLFPKLFPLMHAANPGVLGPIDAFTGMGGVADWKSKFPPSPGCQLNSTWAPCAWWCDKQICGQCHPNGERPPNISRVRADRSWQQI